MRCIYRSSQNKEILKWWQILIGWNIKEPSANDTIIREVGFNKTFRWAGTGLSCNTSQSYVKYESFLKPLFESSRSVRTDSSEEDEPMQILCRYLLLEYDWSRGGGAPSQASLKARRQAVHLRSVSLLPSSQTEMWSRILLSILSLNWIATVSSEP